MSNSNRPVAIVTGASRGLGRATSVALAEKGWRLVIDARTDAPLRKTAEHLSTLTDVAAIPGDVTALDHRQALLALTRGYGRLDALINNASTLGPTPLPSLAAYSINALRNVLEVNTIAPLALIQETLPLLRETNGVIVNITSDAALEPYPGWGGYGSSKAALDQVSRILGSEEPEVGVYSFDPGDMNTQMHQDAFPGEDISDRPDPEDSVPSILRLLHERPPSGRYAVSDLMARA